MVDIYKTFNGLPFEEGLAKFAPVRKEIRRVTKIIGQDAAAGLAGHRSEGHSFIKVAYGPVDGMVILNDERGQKAAMSIEFGRGAADPNDPDYDKDPFPNGTVGTYVLHKASGLRKSAHFPHSKRKKKYRKKRR